ncbi:MAG: GerAB/ArcD/ProY family transporter [Bacilli bacterium]|nr:GerAB/ArcD/ProY family transporter [Bacilli bacterium]
MKKISSLEYNTLIWFILRSCFIELTFTTLINQIKQDSWISIIIASVLGLIPFSIYEILKQKFPNDTLITLNEKIYKNSLINIILFVGCLIASFCLFWMLIKFTNALFLSKTSPWIISLALIIPIGYASTKNIHIIGKISLILFYINIIFNIVIMTGLTGNIDINGIKPILENKFSKVFSCSFIFVGYNIAKLFFLTIISKKEIKNYSSKINLITYIISCTNMLSIITTTICVFGIDLTLLYEYPAFQILKRVNILGALDRIESILSLEAIFSDFILIIIIMYYARKIISKTFKTKQKTNKYIIIFICIFTIITSNTIFISHEEGEKFFNTYLLYIIYFICIFLPLLTLLKSLNNKEQNKQYQLK